MNKYTIKPGFSLVLLATVFLASNVNADAMVMGNVLEVSPGDSVPVAVIPDNVYLRTVDDPDDIVWERLPEYRIHLTPAPPVHASVALRAKSDDPGADLVFIPARTSDRLYMRMRWRDGSKDVQTSGDKFRDGVAVQFSLADHNTSFMMGTNKDAPVNIWYWRSDLGEVENLAAGGFGSTTRLEEQSVSGASQYIDRAGESSEWVVVMSRALSAAGEHQVDLSQDIVPIALAMWQGADKQRDGLKAVTMGWLNLTLGGIE